MNCLGLDAKILIVCDLSYGRYFDALLSRAGYDVMVVPGCRQAAKICQQEQFSLIMIAEDPSDLLVEALCRQLRADEWHSIRPIVILLHGHDQERLSLCFSYGVSDVICSPIPGPELVLRLNSMLNRVDILENAYAEKFANMSNALFRQQDKLRSQLESMITHRIYCETIYSVTEGHFILLDYDEFDDYLSAMEPCKQFSADTKVDISEITDVDKAIDMCDTVFGGYQDSHPEAAFDEDDIADMCLCCSEMACNIIKHGGGLGSMNFSISEEDVRLYSSDHGTGINEMFLANALFMGGASSRKSFGFGFTILYEVADYIVMTTGLKGTRMMLIKSRQKAEPEKNKYDEILARF